MRVDALKLEDRDFADQWSREVEHRWVYDYFVRHEDWRTGWISFDCALYNPDDDRVYLGITCFDANGIFKAYDRKQGAFVDLGYERVADPYDAKFHRALVKSADGRLYAAPALLHCPDRYLEAPGAAVIRYDPQTGDIGKLGTVLPHVYIQSLVLDDARRTVYALCFAPEYLASYNLDTGAVRTLALLGSGYGGMAQGENIVLDDAGCVWSNWSLTRAWQNEPGPDAVRLCKYDPQQDRVVFFQKGLPPPDGSQGYARPEALFNLGDGMLYASGANGSLYRVDPETAHAELLFTPTPDRRSRLSSLVKTEDGIAYGITGRDGQCELIRVHYREGRFEKLGPVRDAQGNAMHQCHDIVAASDGTLYACENDNPHRSSYLWEIEL